MRRLPACDLGADILSQVETQTIPLFDLSRETNEQRSALSGAWDVVLDSGSVIMGPQHNAFEAEFASYVGAAGSVGVANGTDALEIALACIGVAAGDTVVTVANAGGYGSIAALRLGARPVFCDVDNQTLLMSAETLTATLDQLDQAPAAIVVTHLFGALAPIEEIVQIAHAAGIPVVEDCAQSIGARVNGQHCGTFGDIATTSFYPTKNLGAIGDGGAAFSMNAELLAAARTARQYGWSQKYHVDAQYGRNSRLDEVQAAVLRIKLGEFEHRMQQRRDIHARYFEANPGLFVSAPADSFAPHLAVIRSAHRAAIAEQFSAAGISTGVHYPILDSQQLAWSTYRTGPLPVSERAVDEILSIPMFPTLRDDEVERVCAVLSRAGS